MDHTVEALVLDLIEWVARGNRSYEETLDAWRTSCPRLPVWEEATERRMLEVVRLGSRMYVRVTPAGTAFLKQCRPERVA
jgi:D-3-phosphoglycerate dehydrogenase